MPNRLKLLPDYECYALWDVDSLDNLDSRKLSISDELKEKISKWEELYDSTLNNHDPSQSGFSNLDEEKEFDLEGRDIWEKLKLELGAEYEISYFSVVENKLV
ncbi:hypothetical protein [Shewanella algae]|uniref:hypothetical protein n=1 Tax=Shewanella algae TaxID=38313 RepID=UPI001C565984|nr:hypothetical protein [Shewanella algae]